MPPARHLHQWLPHWIDEVMLDQQVPEAVGALVQVRHRHVERNGPPVFWPTPPDGRMREEALIDPGISLLELLRGHVLRLKDGMAGVVEIPVTMQDAALCFHLA